ncbi:MAG: AAA family ATPase [Fibrobacter sp.]|nr:AAA family ATPase [Fibrobacter sp.]
MFDSVKIERFRGINHADISGFRLVNLFLGKNNCGKSSLLEAVFLACGQSNPLLPLNINSSRDYKKIQKKDISLDYSKLDTEKDIRITLCNEESRNLSISFFEQIAPDIKLDENGKSVSSLPNNQYGHILKYSYGGQEMVSKIVFESSGPISQDIDFRYKEHLKCRYLGPRFDFYTSIQGLDNIIKNKAENVILDALKIIEPSIKDFRYSDGDVLVDIGLDQRIPINVLGDGVRKIVSLLTSIYECRDGVLLVDEISNGFHYSVMAKLWNVVIEACKNNQVQLFATTHDLDSIRGLSEYADDESVAAFHLEKLNDDELKGYYFSKNDLEYTLRQSIEVR